MSLKKNEKKQKVIKRWKGSESTKTEEYWNHTGGAGVKIVKNLNEVQENNKLLWDEGAKFLVLLWAPDSLDTHLMSKKWEPDLKSC